jgi:endonuclease-3
MPDAPDQPTPQARRRAARILDRLAERYPTAETALRYDDPWQLLVATVLSAQTTDDTVNRVTPPLFARWPTPEDLANADPEEVEAVVRPSGFFRQKTRSIISLSRDLVERFGGVVPDDLGRLVELRGVGRKTASVVLAEAFGAPAIAVDTHVQRVAGRLDLTRHRDPTKIEGDLKALFPRPRWASVSMRFIHFGRDICDARRPRCWECPLARTCRWPGKVTRPP